MTLKKNKYINYNTLSGSVPMRDECGMYWEVQDGKLLFNNLITTLGYDIEKELYNKTENFSTSGKIKHVTLDHNALDSLNERALVPIYRAPMRIYGNSSEFLSDTEWKNYVTKLFANTTYSMFNFECDVPYTNFEAKTLAANGGAGNYSTFSINPKYNYYLKNYENYSQLVNNERSIVDINNLMLSTTFTDLSEISSSSGLSAHIYNFLTRGIVESGSLLIDSFKKISNDILPPEYASEADDKSTVSYTDKALRMREYLNDFFIKNQISSSMAAMYNLTMNNIYFGDKAMKEYILDGFGLGRENLATAFPYYNEIRVDLETETNDTYRTIIEDNNFSEQLLHNLRTIFKDYSEPIIGNQSYYVVQEQDLLTTTGISSEQISTRVMYKSCNALDLLKTAYNVSFASYAHPTFNAFNVFGAQRQNSGSDGVPDFLFHLSDATGSMRYFRTESSLETLNEFVPNISDISVSSPFECSKDYEGNSLYALYQAAAGKLPDASTFGNYKETIAYRLSKRDDAGVEPMQDWWFYNTRGMGTSPSIFYQDSQVKYGKKYTYTLYAYKLVGGIKHRASNLIVTRRIGTTEVDSREYNCLEFYDPNTGDYSPMLFSGSDNVEVVDLTTTSSIATPAQIYTDQSYLADLFLNYESALEIIEVPIASKECTILDHPANPSDVVPFQVMNDSQKIGFFIDYADFKNHSQVQEGNFPPILPIREGLLIDDYTGRYKNSYDIIDDTYTTETPSKPVKLAIYRTNEKPNSYQDLPLYKTINVLQEDNEDIDSISNYVFYDKINTNTKYYYAFSFLNEHNINGHPGPIIEAELIDDGGYKYSLFNQIFQKQLDEPPIPETTLSFKKLIQILPAIQQIKLDDTNVDYNLTGNENLSLLEIGDSNLQDPVWDKKFKIRLTSKKTGRMIDINLTFNIEEEEY